MVTSTHIEYRLRSAIFFTACAFCLLIPALYNGYPLVTPDTGSYIESGWILHVPVDRPITYGIFIRIASLGGLSLWGVVWSQAFILVYYLKRVSARLLGVYFNNAIFVCIVLLLTAFTSVGWFCGQLMPDIFTSILILCIADFYLSPRGNKKQQLTAFLLIWFFMQMHNSNLLITLLFCVLARLYSLVHKNKWFIKKTIFLFGVTLFSFISISFFNLWEGNSFRPSASTHVFLMSRMAENGILDQFLEEYCPTEHYTLCNYQHRTGDRQWDFMWAQNGPIDALGGWEKSQPEFQTILLRTLTRPKYLGLQIYEALEGTLRQLPQFGLSFMVQDKSSTPYRFVELYFPREIKEYRTSLQQQGQLPGVASFENASMLVFFVILTAVALVLFTKNRQDPPTLNWNFVAILFVVFIILNAFVTATFSTVIDRLQSRVIWLLPFGLLLFVIQYFLSSTSEKHKIPL